MTNQPDNHPEDPGMVPGGTVTFLFTDIEGSTKLLEQLREDYVVLLEEQRDLLRRLFARWNGHEVDTQGDAFFVAFPRAIDAVACTIEAQQALAEHTWPQGVKLRVRMGLHTGEPIVARKYYVGMDVHRAARIASAGHGGQVLISQSTRELIYQDLPQGTSLRDLGEYRLKDIRFPQRLYQLEIEGLPSEFPPLKSLSTAEQPPTPGQAPYKGLQHFDEKDTAWFFGRQQVIRRLQEAIESHRFLAVVGASGSGKSSVVRAGLVPALKHTPTNIWQVSIFTPTSRPLESLAVSLTRSTEPVSKTASLLDSLARDRRSLHLYLQRSVSEPRNVKFLLVVDQLEELFTQCRDQAERQAFVDNLVYATRVENGPVHVVVTLRADFYEQVAQYPDLRELVSSNQIYIGAMNAAELREAIEAPAALGGWELSPGLVDLILFDVGAAGGRSPEPGALPLLSHALLETWKHRRGNLLNLKAYSEAGGVRRAIAHTADHVYNVELTSSQQRIARTIFLRLTELGEEEQDTRRRIQITELIPPGPAGESEQIQAVLLVLADARLITTGDGTVEVAHEALIREWPLLREWLTEGREGLRLHRHLTEASQEWELFGRDPGALYRGARLTQAVEWALKNPQQLNSLEQAFISASREAAEQEETEREVARQRELEQAQELARMEKQRAEEQSRAAQSLRRRAMLLLGAVIIAVGLAAAALFFANQSRANASMAAIRQAEAEANAMLAQSQKATAEAEGQIRATAEFVAIQQRQVAEQQTTLTRSRELALAAINNLEANPELSILLSLEGLAITHTLEAESALHRSLLASHLEDRLPAPYLPIRPSMTYSPDGSQLAYLVAAPDAITTTLILEDQNNGTTLLQVEKPGWLGDQFHQVSIAFSPDGKMLVAGMSNDPELQIWDSATGKEIRSLDLIDNAAENACEWRFGKFQAGIYALGFSPDGSWFGTVECDGGQMFVRARDATTGVPLFSTPFSGEPNPLAKVVISADSKRIAADPVIDGHVVVLDALSGEGLFRLKHNQGVDDKYENMLRAIATDPQSNRIATVGWGDVARIWDADTGEQLQAIAVGSPEVWGVAFSPDGKQLATGSPDGKTRLWDLDTGKELLTLTGSNERVFDVLFHPNGQSLIARDFSAAAIWDITPGHELFTLEENSTYNHLEISPQGDRLATADNEGHVKVLDAQTGEKLLDIPAHEGYVNWVHFSPDGSQIASASADGKVKTWDSTTGELLSTLQDGSDAFFATMFNPKGGQLTAIGCCDPALNTWDVSTGEIITTIIRPEDVVWNGVTGIYDSSGERLFSDHIIWDAQTGEVLANLDVSLVEQDVTVADFSPDGRQIALGGYNGYLIFYDSQTGDAGQPIQAHSGPVWSMDYSPDGSRLATASVDGTVKLWDSRTGALQLTLSGYPQPVTGVVFSPDGRMLYTADNDGQVRGYILPIDELVSLAHARLTRNFSQDECLNYRISPCPKNP